MRLVILLVAVLVGGAVLVYGTAYVVTKGSRRVPPPRGLDPAAYRNHQHMARVLDNIVNDDFTAGVLPDAKKREIRSLLADFYDDPSIERGD